MPRPPIETMKVQFFLSSMKAANKLSAVISF